jgi:hypothetical protein
MKTGKHKGFRNRNKMKKVTKQMLWVLWVVVMGGGQKSCVKK